MPNPEEMNDDELEAAQSAADGEPEASTDPTETTTEEATTTEATQEQSTSTDPAETTVTTTTEPPATAEAQTSAVAEPVKVKGVASKDGTGVIPYTALQAERRGHRQAAARAERAEKEAERLKQEIDDLRAGKSPASNALTEEEVQQLETDFPERGATARKIFERNKELEQQIAATKPKEAPADDIGDDPVQEVLDQVPLLVEWQHDPQHADKWQRSIELDNALINSPKWKGKPAIDRFTHVANLVADEFDIEVEKPQPAATAASPKQPAAKPAPDPKKVVESAERQPPSTLSDLKGGAIPDHGQVDFGKLSPNAMLGRFMDMTPEEMDRQLARLG